jgi:hypothetical protein
LVNRGTAILTIKIAAESQSDKRRLRVSVTARAVRQTPIREEAPVRKLENICRDLQRSAQNLLRRRENVETCIGVCFVSALVAVGAALPMI